MGKKTQLQSYRVKDILQYKVENDQEYFLVWWYGYPKREATWEPKANLQDLYDFDSYYTRLRQSYLQEGSKNQPRQQSNNESSLRQSSIKSKKISKAKREKQKNEQIRQQPKLPTLDVQQIKRSQHNERDEHNERNGQKEQNEQSVQNEQVEWVELTAESEIELLGVTAEIREEVKKQLKASPPAKFQIRIQSFKSLPFLGQKLKKINQSFIKGGKMMYEVELDSVGLTEPIIISERYLQLMWPQQFAIYLATKIMQ